MEYIYAALLLHKLGKEISEANLKKVIEAAGVNADESKIKTLIASIKGVNIDKAMEEASFAPVAAAHAPGAGAEKKEHKEEKPEERKEMVAEGLSALFG